MPNMKRTLKNGDAQNPVRRDALAAALALAVDSEAIARAAIEDDLSVRNGTFAYELHPMIVFNPGCIPAGRRV